MDTNGYQNISMDRLVQLMEHKDFVHIKVHIPFEVGMKPWVRNENRIVHRLKYVL